MSNEKLYAIIDGASEEELMPMLAELDPPAACLYAPPVQPDLVDIAPYVVLVTEEVQEWLNTRETPWGIYITADADLKSIRSHLRKYLYVLLPDSDQPVFFRFYDPRNIWDFIAVLDDWALHSFMGPVIQIASNWDGKEKERDFAEQRAPFPMDSLSRVPILSLSDDQYEQIQNKKQSDYIKQLSLLMEKWDAEQDVEDGVPSEPPVYTLHYHKVEAVEPEAEKELIPHAWRQVAEELTLYLAAQDIEDDRSIRGLAMLFVKKKILSTNDLPENYIAQLERTDEPGFFKAEELLINEFGYVPV